MGTQALDVVRHNPDRFKVVGSVRGGTNQELLVGQIREFLPPHVAIADEEAARDIKEHLGPLQGVEVLVGPDAAETLARDTEADMVLNALVGSAGLGPTLATLQAGKTLALANKESLVVGGELVMDLVKGEPERLLPVDSSTPRSRSACGASAERTSSASSSRARAGPSAGGPTPNSKACVKEALAHPVWTMGPKITIDSATLMNKGLEVIEAHYLFDLDYSQIHVVDPSRGDRPRASPSSVTAACSPRWRGRHAAADPAGARLAGAPANGHGAGPAHRARPHFRAGRSRSLPCGRSGLPCRRFGASRSRRS